MPEKKTDMVFDPALTQVALEINGQQLVWSQCDPNYMRAKAMFMFFMQGLADAAWAQIEAGRVERGAKDDGHSADAAVDNFQLAGNGRAN